MKKLTALAMGTVVALSASAAAFAEETDKPFTGGYKYFVEGFEWGPSVTAVVVSLPVDADPDSVKTEAFSVTAESGDDTVVRTVLSAYVSDENAVPTDEASSYVTLRLEYGGSVVESSPFTYDITNGFNYWSPPNYYITAELTFGGEPFTVEMTPDDYKGRIVPEIDDLKTGSYTEGGLTLQYAAYEPDSMKNDTIKQPLIIWLHGAGEGGAGKSGADVSLALLANDVTEIMKDTVQKYFADGAYVFVPQSPTVWMDNGKGQHGGTEPSIYTSVLKYAIDAYIKENGDIDLNRVYIGGCSNGGYMTMNMLIEYPGFFAAGYPVCEAYMDSFISDEKLDILKNVPLWFTQSRDDSTVAPVMSAIPTFTRLVAGGAKDVHFSFFDTVEGQDEPGAQYMGHFSWVYSHSDRSVKDQDHAWIIENADAILAKAAALSAVAPPAWGAPDERVIAPVDFPASASAVTLNGKDVGMWEWLASQTLTSQTSVPAAPAVPAETPVTTPATPAETPSTPAETPAETPRTNPPTGASSDLGVALLALTLAVGAVILINKRKFAKSVK